MERINIQQWYKRFIIRSLKVKLWYSKKHGLNFGNHQIKKRSYNLIRYKKKLLEKIRELYDREIYDVIIMIK